MKGHDAVTGPEGDECSQLVAELGHSPDETSSELGGGTFGDSEICCDVYAAES